MCLLSKRSTPMTADRDITCYKIVHQRATGEFATPFQLTTIDITPGSVQTAQGDSCIEKHPDVNRYRVAAGYVHTFAEAKEILLDMTNYPRSSLRIIECHIPKGETFFSWKMLYTPYNVYASKSIVYGRDVTARCLVS